MGDAGLTNQLIDIHACSGMLGLSVSTIRKMCMNKEIPFVKIGKRIVRFYVPELKKWIQNNQEFRSHVSR